MSKEIPDMTEGMDRLLELGAAEARPFIPEGGDVPVMVLPGTTTVISLERFLPPQRIKQVVALNEASSFVEYVNRFKSENTMVFCNPDPCKFVALLDYHSPAPSLKPAYCQHAATFAPLYTPEWLVWVDNDRDKMHQHAFAEFLEDNVKLFVEPKGAELLELVTSLHGHNNARFNTLVRLATGAFSASYEEDVVIKGGASSKAGELALPPIIKAGIAVFQGGEKYAVTARLKVRVEERKLYLCYETVSLADILRESLLLLVKEIAVKTKIVPLIGAA